MVRPKVAPMARNNNKQAEPTTQSTQNTQLIAVHSKQQGAAPQKPAQVRNGTNTKSFTTDGEEEDVDTTEDTSNDSKNNKGSNNQRKRRMASLNAEFLVHYSNNAPNQTSTFSVTNSHNNTTSSLSNNNNNKRKRTNSDNSSKNKTNEIVVDGRRGSTRLNKQASVVEPVVAKARQTTKRSGTKKSVVQAVEQKLELNAESYQDILNDFAVREDGEETGDGTSNQEDDSDDDYKAPKSKGATKRQPTKRKQSENHVNTNGSGKKSKAAAVVTQPALPLISSRPKREAGLRASAMIIQTNEIEKTKYQYHYSNSNPALSSLALPAQQQQQQPPNSTEHTKLKTSHSFSSFQIPQFSSKVYVALANNNNNNNNNNNSSTAQQLKSVKKQPVQKPKITGTDQNNNNSSGNQLRQISTTTTLGGPVVVTGDDDSSNDVLIIEPPTQKMNNGSKPDARSYPVLTEDLMKEHHKTHDTGTGNGTFSQFTRDYIIKWILEYKHTDEKPYEPVEIPIESFGVKVLNDPQYLIVKSRQESAQAASSAILSRQSQGATFKPAMSGQPLIIKPKVEATQLESNKHHQQQHTNSSNDNLINDCKKLLSNNKAASQTAQALLVASSAINDASGSATVTNAGATNANGNDNGGNIASNINYFPTKCISAS